MCLTRCPKCNAPAGTKKANWKTVLNDIRILGSALSEACETLEQVIPGWERSPQWRSLAKALGRADYWRHQQEEANE